MAGRLFAAKGFAGTSTREIAEAAGLRQPSLFHYYPKKELILRALLERISTIALGMTRSLDSAVASPAAKLYRTIHEKILRVRTATYPVGSIVALPEIRDDAFESFWTDNEESDAIILGFIKDGIAAGQLDSDDPELSEYILRGMPIGPLAWGMEESERPAEPMAHHAAALQLRALGLKAEDLPAIREEAMALTVDAPAPTPAE